MKSILADAGGFPRQVAPARERGLKYLPAADTWRQARRRSREGAWIEMTDGLNIMHPLSSRSREGAWIEIQPTALRNVAQRSRSREGAWIEMLGTTKHMKLLSCRSREGAWIEMHLAE